MICRLCDCLSIGLLQICLRLNAIRQLRILAAQRIAELFKRQFRTAQANWGGRTRHRSAEFEGARIEAPKGVWEAVPSPQKNV